jgi:kumamolisin
MASKMVSIPGSKKKPFRAARVVAPAPSDERLEVTLRIRPKKPLPKAAEMLKLSNEPIEQLTHEQYGEHYGATAEDLDLVKKFARKYKLNIVRESAARRTVIVAGTVADMNRAFGVSLKTYAYADGTYRGRTGPVQVPADIAPVIEGVFGLDNRPVAKRQTSGPQAAANSARSFTGAELAKIYNFPEGFDGAGQTIGIIELGGGYRPSDLDAYFSSLGLPTPTVVPVSVDGGANAPSSASGGDVEVVLDIQVAGGAAPGAKYVLYFAPNDATSSGFLDALTKAIHDTENNPSVVSISWGAPESISTENFQVEFNKALQAAAMLGITVCVAAGDNGAAGMGPRFWDGKAHVDFPSSSPFSLSCGGTRLLANDAILRESVWNQGRADLSPSAGRDGSFGSGGGGVSGAFPLPDYQQQAKVPRSLNPAGFQGRGVPDVTGNGDPETGYNILVDGQQIQEGGTSAVAPLWAALIARINQKLNGRVGFINPQLYALPPTSGAFHDISVGSNRVSSKASENIGYDAGLGWDAASGLGSPDGTVLSNLLKAGAPAQASSVSQGRVGKPAANRQARASAVSTRASRGTKRRTRE